MSVKPFGHWYCVRDYLRLASEGPKTEDAFSDERATFMPALKFARDRIVIQIVSVFRLSSSSISDAKYTSHDRLVAINWILIRFLQGHRKLKLPPCGEFQSRMNLVMYYLVLEVSLGQSEVHTSACKSHLKLDTQSINYKLFYLLDLHLTRAHE